jgi:hypothetical protein
MPGADRANATRSTPGIRREQLAETKKLEARPIGKIVTRKSGVLVGYLYEWNTGERQNAWLKRPWKHVVIEALEPELEAQWPKIAGVRRTDCRRKRWWLVGAAPGPEE